MTSLPPKPPEPAAPLPEQPKTSPQEPYDSETSQETTLNQATSPVTSQPAPSNIPPNILAQILASQRGGFPFGGSPMPPFMIPVQAPQAQTSLQVWHGQYPPPEAIERYEKTLPGAFNRIIAMTEGLQAAQIKEAEQIRLYTYSDGKRGHYLGFLTTILAMACAVYCIQVGNQWIASIFLGVPVISVAKSLIESVRKEKPSDIVKAATQSNPTSENTP